MLSEAKAECRKELTPLLEASGALEYSWQRARRHVKDAVDALECLPNPTPSRCFAYLPITRSVEHPERPTPRRAGRATISSPKLLGSSPSELQPLTFLVMMKHVSTGILEKDHVRSLVVDPS